MCWQGATKTETPRTKAKAKAKKAQLQSMINRGENKRGIPRSRERKGEKQRREWGGRRKKRGSTPPKTTLRPRRESAAWDGSEEVQTHTHTSAFQVAADVVSPSPPLPPAVLARYLGAALAFFRGFSSFFAALLYFRGKKRKEEVERERVVTSSFLQQMERERRSKESLVFREEESWLVDPISTRRGRKKGKLEGAQRGERRRRRRH